MNNKKKNYELNLHIFCGYLDTNSHVHIPPSGVQGLVSTAEYNTHVCVYKS